MVCSVSPGSNRQYCRHVSELKNEQLSGDERNIRFQILRVAKQLITGQLGVIAASRQLSPLRHSVEPQVAKVLLTFAGIEFQSAKCVKIGIQTR
jgi:hypothetical protein